MKEGKGRNEKGAFVASVISGFFGFLADGWSNPEVFKPTAPQGQSSPKISVHYCSPFRRSLGTNKETQKLTDILLL